MAPRMNPEPPMPPIIYNGLCRPSGRVVSLRTVTCVTLETGARRAARERVVSYFLAGSVLAAR